MVTEAVSTRRLDITAIKIVAKDLMRQGNNQ